MKVLPLRRAVPSTSSRVSQQAEPTQKTFRRRVWHRDDCIAEQTLSKGAFSVLEAACGLPWAIVPWRLEKCVGRSFRAHTW
jgi:hypothetical protein